MAQNGSAPKLTSKQKKVVTALEAGKSPKDIAKSMGISVNGVHGHIRRLRKIGALPQPTGSRSRAGTRRATTRGRRASSNGRLKSPAARALAKAVSQAKGRLHEIDVERQKLDAEEAEIKDAITV